VGNFGGGRDVGDVEQRVGRGFHPDVRVLLLEDGVGGLRNGYDYSRSINPLVQRILTSKPKFLVSPARRLIVGRYIRANPVCV